MAEGCVVVLVVVLASWYFKGAIEGFTAGENVWAQSMIDALNNLGYTAIYAPSLSFILDLYALFPNLVRIIIADPSMITECNANEDCIFSPKNNPYGIPLYKFFAFNFWAQSQHPLGPLWTISPEPYILQFPDSTPNTYIGYSIEAPCIKQHFIPHVKRTQPPIAYIMGKLLRYFLPTWSANAWRSQDIFDAAMNETGVRFMIGAAAQGTSHDPGSKEEMEGMLPAGFENVGPLGQAEFLRQLGNSVALVGTGDPATSPTPYEALCLGVPFINPILRWNLNNPQDRLHWQTQHAMLAFLDPPYVYNVQQGDSKGFVAAIRGALQNPIERFILDRMKIEEVERRVEKLVEVDWKARARDLVKSGETGVVFSL